MLVALYWLSLVVIIGTALVIALHPDIPGGFIGTWWLGGVCIFAMAGLSHTPQTWLVGFMVCLAGVCAWGASRWLYGRGRA